MIETDDGASAVGCSRRDAPLTLSFLSSSRVKEKTSAGFSSAEAPSAAHSFGLRKQNNNSPAARLQGPKEEHPKGSRQHIDFTGSGSSWLILYTTPAEVEKNRPVAAQTQPDAHSVHADLEGHKKAQKAPQNSAFALFMPCIPNRYRPWTDAQREPELVRIHCRTFKLPGTPPQTSHLCPARCHTRPSRSSPPPSV